jgi:hypothetical protein
MWDYMHHRSISSSDLRNRSYPSSSVLSRGAAPRCATWAFYVDAWDLDFDISETADPETFAIDVNAGVCRRSSAMNRKRIEAALRPEFEGALSPIERMRFRLMQSRRAAQRCLEGVGGIREPEKLAPELRVQLAKDVAILQSIVKVTKPSQVARASLPELHSLFDYVAAIRSETARRALS